MCPHPRPHSGLVGTVCPWTGGMDMSLGETDSHTCPQPIPVLSVLLARTTGARSGNIHSKSGTASWHLNRDPKSCFTQVASLLGGGGRACQKLNSSPQPFFSPSAPSSPFLLLPVSQSIKTKIHTEDFWPFSFQLSEQMHCVFGMMFPGRWGWVLSW